MKRCVTRAAVVFIAGAVFACSDAGSGGGGADGGGSSSGSVGSGSGTSSGSGSAGSSSGMSSGSASGGSSGGSASPGVSLTINSAGTPPLLGGGSPAGNSFFVVVDITLKNTGASAPLSANFVLFSLETGQALVVSASTVQPATQCSPMVSVAVGGQDECQVAFEVPVGQTPTTLLYDDQHGDKASASLPAIAPSSACDTFEGWGARASLNGSCSLCLGNAVQVTCANEISAYRDTCGSDAGPCASCASSVDACSCESSCETPACHALYGAQMSCIVSACSSSCP